MHAKRGVRLMDGSMHNTRQQHHAQYKTTRPQHRGPLQPAGRRACPPLNSHLCRIRGQIKDPRPRRAKQRERELALARQDEREPHVRKQMRAQHMLTEMGISGVECGRVLELAREKGVLVVPCRVVSLAHPLRAIATPVHLCMLMMPMSLRVCIYLSYMSMCVCVCACVRACVRVHVYMYVCMHACMHAYMHVCMHVCMYVCMHVCMYVCM